MVEYALAWILVAAALTYAAHHTATHDIAVVPTVALLSAAVAMTPPAGWATR